jgi:four helix bundle protein
MDHRELAGRTKEFAKRIITLCHQLPNSPAARRIGDQLFRSGTSVGANYRAARRARSKAEFVAKMGIVLEEADESLYWLELLGETGIVRPALLRDLTNEADELVAIFVAAITTAKKDGS